MKIPYRSPGLRRGVFNTLGTLHMHIDGAEDQMLILRLVHELERRGNPGKLNHVDSFIAGPQREVLPTVYQSHTPQLAGEEALKFFSTSALKDREDAIRVVNFTGDTLYNTPGVVIEVEQPVMWCGSKGWRILPELDYVAAISAHEVKLAPSPSLKFEIHHGFDLKKSELQQSLEYLSEFCVCHHVEFGGWFVFEKDDVWAYRSNSFASADRLVEQVEREQEALNLFLGMHTRGGKVRTLVENIIGIWHS